MAEIKRFVAAAWRWIGHVSTAAWLWSVAGSLVLAMLASIAELALLTILLVIAAIISGILAGLATWGPWSTPRPEERHFHHVGSPEETDTALPATVVREPAQPAIEFSAPDDADLEVFLVHEEFHPFRHKAILLEAKFDVRNRTNKTKHVLSTAWEIDPPEGGGPARYHDLDARQALYELQQGRAPEFAGTISPHDTLSGWVHVALAHQPWGGVGGYTVTMEDELGTQYVLRRDRRGSRKPEDQETNPL